MVLVRVVTIFGIGLSVVAILLQNQSPILSLVFLGERSQPLSLGLWVAGAVVLGALVSLGMLAILSFASVAPSSPRTSRRRSSFRWPKFNAPRPKPRAERPSQKQPQGYSDWDQAPATDWYGEPTPRSEPFFDDEYDDDPIDDQDYGNATPPWAKRDSSYSYSSGDSEFADQSGQRESVFDAEYKVINPPKRPASSNSDWDDYDEFVEN